MNYRLALVLILLVYLAMGVLYAVKTPDWQVPDEPAHYNYIRQLAEEQRLPILKMGDYDQDYLNQLTTHRFPPELSIEDLEYEDWQPPLYYLLATPIFLAWDGALTPLRLFSVLLGVGVVICAYAVAATVFPERPLIALGTAAFVAFLPQHVAMMAGVNNDSLAELLIGVALWLTCTLVGRPDRRRSHWVGLGGVLGLGLLTKASFLPLALVAGLAVLLAWRREALRTWSGLARTLVLVGVPALLITAPWWLRNVATYGGLDLYGTANHNTVVVGQPLTSEWIADYGWRYLLTRCVTTTFQSFWGQFGWMGVVMPTWLYRALLLWSGALSLGFLYRLRQSRAHPETHKIPGTRSVQLALLGTTVLLVLLVYFYYNLTFVQHQGRYLFPALIPIALGVALGTKGLLRGLRFSDQWQPWAFAAPYVALVALDLYALWRIILPALG